MSLLLCTPLTSSFRILVGPTLMDDLILEILSHVPTCLHVLASVVVVSQISFFRISLLRPPSHNSSAPHDSLSANEP